MLWDINTARVQYRVPIGSAAHRVLHARFGPGDVRRELLMARYIFRQDALTRWESETPGIRRALAPYRWALDKQPWGSPGALEGLWFQPARKSWHITGSYTVYGPYGEQTVDLDFMVERQPGTRRPDEAAVRETLQWELDERIDEYAAVFDNG